jgi:hypothetical protein
MSGRRLKRLRLRACDSDDLRIVAACMQDAMMPIAEMKYEPAERRFISVCQRLSWEHRPRDMASDQPRTEPLYQVVSGFRVEHVEAVSFRNIDRSQAGLILSLLTIVDMPDGVTLLFSGGGAIRLTGNRVVCLIEDLGPPAVAPRVPTHVEDKEKRMACESIDDEGQRQAIES